jgi:hypothetical protein
MARRSVRNVMPARSDKAADKLMAALRYTYGEMAAQGRKTAESPRRRCTTMRCGSGTRR